MESKRRYESGIHPVYDQKYARKCANSPVLNPRAVVDHHTILADKRNIEGLILEKRGNDEGMYYLPGQRATLAALPAILVQIGELEEQFKKASQAQVNIGRGPLEDWPSNLLEKRFEFEAEYDTVLLEVEELEKRLSVFVDQKVDKSDNLVLKSGTNASGQLRHGYLVEIDGQVVKPDESGVLRIDDVRSPYDKMKSVDYYSKVALPWRKAKMKLDNERDKIYHGLKGSQLSNEMREEWATRRAELFKQNPTWADLFGLNFKGKMIPDPEKIISNGDKIEPITRTKKLQKK